MDVSLYQAAAAMNATARWEELISDNLASAAIPGARRREISFSAVQAGLATGVPGQEGSNYMMPAANTVTNFQPGELRPTGGPMDFALEGPGLFTVQMPNKQRAYTRDGEFQLNAQGQLATKQGYLVLGDNGPLQFDPNSPDPIVISASGDVSQGSDTKGRLQIAEFAHPDRLTGISAGLFRADDPSIKPNVSSSTRVRQGFVEAANTSPSTEMATLITAMRLFETNQKVMQMQDDRMGRVISDLGNPG
jgi:flagellar basal-body rod protein FlgF